MTGSRRRQGIIERPPELPSHPYSSICDACGREGMRREGGWWCPWCRRWLNDHRGWKLLV